MTIKELITKLQSCNPAHEVDIYIAPDDVIEAGEYAVHEPEVNPNNGWDGVVTLELGKFIGG